MYADRLRDGESKLAARRKVGELLGINPATLRNWIEAAEKADRPVEPSGLSLADENARLKKENAELRRADEILKTASAFFAPAGLDRRLPESSPISPTTAASSASSRSVPCSASTAFRSRRTPTAATKGPLFLMPSWRRHIWWTRS